MYPEGSAIEISTETKQNDRRMPCKFRGGLVVSISNAHEETSALTTRKSFVDASRLAHAVKDFPGFVRKYEYFEIQRARNVQREKERWQDGMRDFLTALQGSQSRSKYSTRPPPRASQFNVTSLTCRCNYGGVPLETAVSTQSKTYIFYFSSCLIW
jgi:hypothetical protein